MDGAYALHPPVAVNFGLVREATLGRTAALEG